MTTCPNCGTRFNDAQRLCPHDGAVLEPDQAPELAQVGKVLDGKYRIDGYISRGGMGAVYRGTHVMLGRPVAVKLISPDLVASPDMVRRFQREARAVTHLDHPHIVKVYDLGQTSDGTLYIAMDLVSGESLNALIRRSGALAPGRIVTILGQVASALALAHRHGVVHRDLKPHNIMIGRDEHGRDVATLLDFGIAKTFEFDAHTKLTATGSTLGTPHYMSPEQAGGVQVDARSDLYSLGIILYEMLVGEVPFTDPSTPAVLVKHLTEKPIPPSERRPDLKVPAALEAIALRCLEKTPENRFQTAAELGAELAKVPVEHTDHEGTIRVSPTLLRSVQTTKALGLGQTESIGFEPAPRWQTVEEATVNNPAPPTVRATATAPPTASATDGGPAPAPTPAQAAPQRSPLVPIAAAILVLAILGGAYWAMTQPREATVASVPPPTQDPPAPARVEAKAEPPATPAATPAAPPAAPPAAAPVTTPAPPASSKPPTQAPALPGVRLSAITDTPLSRALADRLRAHSLRYEKFCSGAVALEMTTRPSGLGRGLTADYSSTIRTSRQTQAFSGSVLGFAELALQKEVIDKAAAEMLPFLVPAPGGSCPDRD
jgi:serine/threonine protein kinase